MAYAPITADKFQALWVSAVDDSYSRPFVENPELSCFEAWEQDFAQLERVSQAIDVSTQAMFIMPWSGMTNPPAAGAVLAEVDLTFTRTRGIHFPLIFDTDIAVGEVTNDAGPDGPEPFSTGRLYSLIEPLVFAPGEAGPRTVRARARRPGYGFNNPLPGTINEIDQPGRLLQNIDAQYVYAAGAERLTAPNFPDMPIPQHVGQYMVFVGGPNGGQIKRVIQYGPPNVAADVGGVFFLESTAALQGNTANPDDEFMVGEQVTLYVTGLGNTVATGQLFRQTGENGANAGKVFVLRLTSGALPTMPAALFMQGDASGVLATIESILLDPLLVSDSAAQWAMVSWSSPDNGFGLTVTNAAQPSGGLAPTLDALGEERDISRSSNEEDDSFRERVHQLADTVSPNAIKRAANRIMAPYGFSACVRETGSELMKGFFLDHDAFDYDFGVRPSLQNHVLLDYEQFRAFLFIGVPKLPWGEFGFAYDVGPWDAYDTTGPLYPAFYDGYPWAAAQFYLSIYNAIANVVAGGVGFTLYFENRGCVP